MLKSFVNIDELFAAIDTDKTYDGVNSGTANRFPVRFVLFDNFRDSYDFISRMSDMDIKIQSVELQYLIFEKSNKDENEKKS